MAVKLTRIKDSFNQQITEHLLNIKCASEPLMEAIRYACLNPGKRLRPLLVYTTGIALGIDERKLDSAALAVELIHCYSLVHDDLPAMDDDDLRRGLPSCHRAFDEATAILVGDALQTLAYQVLMEDKALLPTEKNAVTLALLRASGTDGMVAGQALDIATLSGDSVNEKTLREVHRLKTGALLEACALMPLCLYPDDATQLNTQLHDFAYHLGLAYQVQDDFLDNFGDTKKLGKQQGSDSEKNKTTYAGLYDKATLINLIQEHYQKARDSLKDLPSDKSLLLTLIKGLESREF